ncbi:hypothetical protein AX769_13520 [Frondihabitans sp. PAMC 28766]|uniref:GH25 family lysozyme n=1 Tax=Frondihabitans sp. PAMC 28766 TaxID=1795630 RepID=UPI00078BF4B5|nr:GH25 family lysozyme [Frondihabitans sp. PAMC 28766]AMM20965.1 hypothetical protein AX769_13520 [Frondihabitans sp. PAMC 28766]
MINLKTRVSAILAASALLAGGLLAGGAAESASADASTCYQTNPTSTSTSVKGFDIFEDTGGSPTAGANIDFAGARTNGACFVYIKASGGLRVTNSNFDEQWSDARSAGLFTGTYYVAAPDLTVPIIDGQSDAQQSAAWFLGHDGQWAPDGKTLPPALDMEINPAAVSSSKTYASDRCYDMTSGELRTWIQQFSTAVQSATTRKPLIYTNQDFWNTCLGGSSAFAANPLWVASYAKTLAMPTGWPTYAFRQTSETPNTPFPGDQDVFNGTLASLQHQALADASARHDYTVDGLPDVLSAPAGGTLSANVGTGSGTLTGSVRSLGITIPSGARVVVPGDMNGDGFADLYAILPSGSVEYWKGLQGGGFASPVVEATGWNVLRTVVGVGDFTGDGNNDVLARTSAGQLWLFPGNGRGGFSSHQLLGSGFQSMTAIVGAGDLTGDGKPDMLVRTSTGQLWIYPRTSTGFATHINGPTGFGPATAIFSVGDFSGDGRDDILARLGGVLKVFKGSGDGKLSSGVVVKAPAGVATNSFVG